MSSKRGLKRRLRRRSCSGKRRFKDQQTAEAVAAHLRREEGSYLVAYKCRFCTGFHYGPVPRKMGGGRELVVEPGKKNQNTSSARHKKQGR